MVLNTVHTKQVRFILMFSYNLCGQLKIEELPPGCLQVGRDDRLEAKLMF